MRRSALFITVALSAGLLTAGCSPTTQAEQKTENANAALCLAVQGLGATIEGVSTGVTGTGDVTVGQAQEAVNQIGEAYADVQAQIEKLQSDVSDQVLAQEEAFQQAQMQVQEGLSGLDGDQNLSDVPKEEQSAIENMNTSYEEMVASLGCTDASQ